MMRIMLGTYKILLSPNVRSFKIFDDAYLLIFEFWSLFFGVEAKDECFCVFFGLISI